MGIVAFSYAAWEARYPEFSAVTQPTAQAYFNEATIYLDNTDCSPVTDTAIRATLLNMLTAHIAAIYSGANGAGPSPLVGRISEATEGTVHVSTDNQYPAGTVQWYQQTTYGSSYWAATARYRQFNYVPGYSPPIGFGGVRSPWPR